MGSAWITYTMWEERSKSYGLLSIKGQDMPEICAHTALIHNLFNTPGWKHFKRRTKYKKTLDQPPIQHQRQQKHFAPQGINGDLKFLPSYVKTRPLDKEHGNNPWADARQTHSIRDKAELKNRDPKQKGCTNLRSTTMYAGKHDERPQNSYVAGGHLCLHSTVVSLHSIIIINLAAKLNRLELFQANVASASLE
jgi:hypothetical protein